MDVLSRGWACVGGRSIIAAVAVAVGWWASSAAAAGWSVQSTPKPPGAASSELTGVSCVSTKACEAVGYSRTSAGTVKTLAEGYNGKRWSIQRTPTPAGAESGFVAVSCASATSCIAIGGGGPFVLSCPPSAPVCGFIERWNGRRWSIQRALKAPAELQGVSCSSPAACTVVGESNVLGPPLVMRYNGRRWSGQPTPAVPYADLSGVSCPSQTSCTAVGANPEAGLDSVAMAMHWNGTKWSIQHRPDASAYSFLFGISCWSPAACTAVGWVKNCGCGGTALAEGWHGDTWKVESLNPLEPPPEPTLFTVSCASSANCMALGEHTKPPEAVVLRWGGKRWFKLHPPNDSGLAGVFCLTATSCTAVGSDHGATLAERWHGTS